MKTITLTTKANTIHLEIDILNSGKYSIDWGDGSKEKKYIITNDNKSKKAKETGIYPYVELRQYVYTDNKLEHTITIKGGITWLDASGNKITSIDISKCSTLLELHCNRNQLTTLDISKNAMLKWLFCGQNKLTSLDVSKNTALTNLYCPDNKLKSLNICGCTKLSYLDCYRNQLTSLDVSGCTALKSLQCYNNQFSASAMNKIYNDLPVVEYGYLMLDRLGDYLVAEAKGWKVYY